MRIRVEAKSSFLAEICKVSELALVFYVEDNFNISKYEHIIFRKEE